MSLSWVLLFLCDTAGIVISSRYTCWIDNIEMTMDLTVLLVVQNFNFDGTLYLPDNEDAVLHLTWVPANYGAGSNEHRYFWNRE